MPTWKTLLCVMPLLPGTALVTACGSEEAARTAEESTLSPGDSLSPESPPTGTDSAGAVATPAWWRPAPGTRWQIQLSGKLNTSFNVPVYDVDLFDTPAATLASLKSQGRKVICYFSAGSYEDWRSDAKSFPAAALGKPLDGWPGERWLDVRATAVRDIMRTRIELARQKGCDAVDPDNVDGYSNDTGFRLTSADQLAFNRFLATEAHARGLAVGLKNDVDQVAQLVNDFDFQVNEECLQYDECDTLRPFITAGKAVFHIEYGNAALAQSVCPEANALGFDTLVKNLELDAARISCR
ncbi:endo alpha-1,4 polygalactosaminidase [Stigmatella sp. ncwal1]|uniref:Endo alpha-1,4 polygalactosaminidase n=1 Tax=Stigmatella ashevillensis TaxID=2995309 RepID=A0ABT5D2R7_9BACT|nr:endo alpha-1,4 polygalactosaminidase [Stigmatella ashevillena]MDC0707364.1 endo alpha-1,4 polygalactosaminidase [Stigmatella ashevillena]